MANIMSQLKLKNNTSRNGFDLSRKNAFTAKIGELLPVACIECIPGDVYTGRVQHFTRTMPVNTAAYTRIREYYDWFFVPTNLLWNKFNTFVTQMYDNTQHASNLLTSEPLSEFQPYFRCSEVADYLATLKNMGEGKYNIFNYDRAMLSAKLLQYLGYGDFTRTAETGTAQSFRYDASLNPFPLLAYQKIYQDYFRNSQWEKAFAPAYNVDYMYQDGQMEIPVVNIAASFQNEHMFDLRYCNWNKDLFMGVMPNSQYGEAASIIPESATNPITRFDSYLYATSEVPDGTSMRRLFYNQDNVSMTNPRPILGATTLDHLYSTDPAVRFQLKAEDVANLRTALGLGSSSVQGFTILALRQAEALQRWQEITQSQQQDYKNQIEAHFGVSMSDAYSERCVYVDGSVSSLDISEVTNTNLADNNAAEIAGKGVGVGDGSFRYEANVHGYLMCIYHAVPLLDYASDGIKRQNLKVFATDYAIPEFDRTGMVSVPVVELTNSPNQPAFTADLLGYAPRYYEYKTAVDEVHGAFINGGLGAWVAPIDSNYLTKYVEAMHGDGSSLTYQWFKVNPAVLNPIFAQSVDSTTMTDQLLINSSFDIKAVRNLDRNGLPY